MVKLMSQSMLKLSCLGWKHWLGNYKLYEQDQSHRFGIVSLYFDDEILVYSVINFKALQLGFWA